MAQANSGVVNALGIFLTIAGMSHFGRKCEYSLQDGNDRSCGNPEVASYLGNGRLQVGTARLVAAYISH